jgi:hypothetical protein
MKFKVGDLVKVTGCAHGGGGLNRDKPGTIEALEGIDDHCYLVSNDGCEPEPFRETELELVVRTMDNLQPGDILVNKEAVLGNIVFTSDTDDSVLSYYIVERMKEEGWTLKGSTPEPEVAELTLDEIASKFDIPVEKLRIKD